jgi:hypothetical protein
MRDCVPKDLDDCVCQAAFEHETQEPNGEQLAGQAVKRCLGICKQLGNENQDSIPGFDYDLARLVQRQELHFLANGRELIDHLSVGEHLQ